MAERVANVLESYDFFGKSIPGIVALIGIATLLPGLPLEAFTDPNGTLNLTVLTALALTLVFSGLVLGQAVHTIADNTEKVLYRMGNWAGNKYYIHSPLISEEWWENHKELEEQYLALRPWLERRYWGIHDIFKSHRRLFENELGWNFDISENAVLNARQRQHRIYDIQFSNGNGSLAMDSEIGRFDPSRIAR